MMQPQTFACKALARASGLSGITEGQIVRVRPDWVMSHDNTWAIIDTFQQIGAKRVFDPDRLVIVLDHAAPPPTPKHAEGHRRIRHFVQEQRITHFYDIGRGISHQVIGEEALVLPGDLLVGADSHTLHMGWLGAFATGLGRSEIAAVWATGEIWLKIPDSIRIELHGQFPVGVTAKDLALAIIKDLGAEGAQYCSIEFHGEALTRLSPDQRMTLANMMAECGAKNAYIPPDDVTVQWLVRRIVAKKGGDPERIAHRIRDRIPYPDKGAVYHQSFHYGLENLEPMIACPHQVDRVSPIQDVAGIPVNLAFIGTCAGGRLEDLEQAAEILKGKRVHPGVRLIVVPASREVFIRASQLGILQTLVEAGALPCTPGCGPCMGNHMGIPAPGETVLSTGNRNYRGRMGTDEARIYLASPAVVAVSALTGRITDPREVMS